MQVLFDGVAKVLGPDRTAYLCWGIASTIWVLGFLYVSEQGIDCYSSNLTRAFALLIFNIPVAMNSPNELLSPESTRCMAYRHVLQALYGLVFAQSFFYLPITVVHTLYSSGPLFVLAMDYFINKVTVTPRQLRGILISFSGVLLTVNGHVIYGILGWEDPNKSDFEHYREGAGNPLIVAGVSLLLLVCTCGWAVAIILVKRIKGASHYQLNCHLGIVLMAMSGLFYSWTNVKEEERMTAFGWGLLLQGLPLAIGQAFFSHALTLTKNYGIMTMIGFLGVVIGYCLKIFRYHEALNALCLVGSLLIMLGVSRIVLKED